MTNMDILIDTLTRYQGYDEAFTIEINEYVNHSNISHNNDLIRIQNDYADIVDEYHIPTIQTVSNPTIRNCLIALFNIENIKTKKDLYEWNGKNGMNKLHYHIEQMASYHYNHIKTPKSSISYCTQTLLDGYKIYKK
jgi:hypothetical protein